MHHTKKNLHSNLTCLILGMSLLMGGSDSKANWVPNPCLSYCNNCWAGAASKCEQRYCQEEDPCVGTSLQLIFCLNQQGLCEQGLVDEASPCFHEKVQLKQCKEATPFCGDSWVTGNEQCEDPGNTDPTCEHCKRVP